MLPSCYYTSQCIHVIMRRAMYFLCQQYHLSCYYHFMKYILEYALLSIDLHNFKTHQLLHFKTERACDDYI